MKPKQYLNFDTEIRAEEGDGVKRLIGLIPYNRRSVEVWGEYEEIAPTAFAKTLADGRDVKALVAHDDSKVLGSTRSGTLRLTSTDEGLLAEVDLPNTTYANDAWEIVKRGDVRTMSFGFQPVKQSKRYDEVTQKMVNVLEEVKLQEVSYMVAYAAYPDTVSMARSVQGINLDKFAEAIKAETPTEEHKRVLEDVEKIVRSKLEPQAKSTTEAAQSTSAGDYWVALMEAAQKM